MYRAVRCGSGARGPGRTSYSRLLSSLLERERLQRTDEYSITGRTTHSEAKRFMTDKKNGEKSLTINLIGSINESIRDQISTDLMNRIELSIAIASVA